jgi:hypothetical protein
VNPDLLFGIVASLIAGIILLAMCTVLDVVGRLDQKRSAAT